MATKRDYPGPVGSLALYERLVETNPDVKRKGAKNPYTSRNGHMFSFLDADGSLALRLSAGDRATFLEAHATEPVVSHGAVMKEYVSVPATLLADTVALREWFMLSYGYIGTLKPKPTKR